MSCYTPEHGPSEVKLHGRNVHFMVIQAHEVPRMIKMVNSIFSTANFCFRSVCRQMGRLLPLPQMSNSPDGNYTLRGGP